MATHFSVLAWRIPGTGEPGGLPSMGLHRVGHNRSDLAMPDRKVSYQSSWLMGSVLYLDLGDGYHKHGFPRWLSGKESACQYRRCKRHRFDPWVRKFLWRREWQSAPVVLPGEFLG